MDKYANELIEEIYNNSNYTTVKQLKDKGIVYEIKFHTIFLPILADKYETTQF